MRSAVISLVLCGCLATAVEPDTAPRTSTPAPLLSTTPSTRSPTTSTTHPASSTNPTPAPTIPTKSPTNPTPSTTNPTKSPTNPTPSATNPTSSPTNPPSLPTNVPTASTISPSAQATATKPTSPPQTPTSTQTATTTPPITRSTTLPPSSPTTMNTTPLAPVSSSFGSLLKFQPGEDTQDVDGDNTEDIGAGIEESVGPLTEGDTQDISDTNTKSNINTTDTRDNNTKEKGDTGEKPSTAAPTSTTRSTESTTVGTGTVSTRKQTTVAATASASVTLPTPNAVPALKVGREMVLTPWWPLELGEGETAQVDCGVYTRGSPGQFPMAWVRPDGGQVSSGQQQGRATVTRKDKNSPADETFGAWSVLTLNLTQLQMSDSGVYTCVCGQAKINITIKVFPKEERCGFEGAALCGWSLDESGLWHWHRSDDPVVVRRQRGPRHDHTYWANKHTGHFLDVDLQHGPLAGAGGTSLATLTSPAYPAHPAQPRCFQMWYVYDGKDQEYLAVNLRSAGPASSDAGKQLFLQKDHHGNAWTLAQIDIEPQQQDYQLVVEVSTCAESCAKAAMALDDVRMSAGRCVDQPAWPDTSLRLRLEGGAVPWEGRLEVLHDGQYGSVCSQQFGKNDSKVTCRMMGYGTENADKERNATSFGSAPENSVVWLKQVACAGDERDLGQCLSDETWGATAGCTHSQDVAVMCTDPTKSSTMIPISTSPGVTSTDRLASTSQADTTLAMSAKTHLPSDAMSTREPGNPNALDVENNDNGSNHQGVVAGVVCITLIAFIGIAYAIYRKKRKYSRKSKYLNFGNPSYSSEHLPSNDFSLESPLNLTSSGYTVLA